MTIRDLTVKERILLHLFDFNRYSGDYDAPLEVTQSGIADAVGIRVQHVTQYARPLIAENLLEGRTSHVQRQPRRRKVYFLTAGGRHRVASLRNSLLGEAVHFKTRLGEVRETSLAKVYQEERRGSTILQLLTELDTNGQITDIAGASVPELVDFTQEAPGIDRFYGRERDLKAVRKALERVPLVVVSGIAGIGKSTLGAKVCGGVRGKQPLFWRRIRPWDKAMDLARSLASYLKAMGRVGLQSYITSPEAIQLSRVEELLQSDLAGIDALLVLDDAHAASEDALNFLSILHEVLKRQGGGTSVLLLSRTVPNIYSRREVSLEGSVAEVSLDGLDPEDCRALLSDAGVPDSLTNELIQLSAGNPLFLRFLANGSPVEDLQTGWKTLETYIAEEIVPALDEVQRGCLQVASFYEVPVPPEGLLLERTGGKETLISLQRSGLLQRLDREAYVVHDVIRGFFQQGLPEERREVLLDRVVPWMMKEAERRVEERHLENAVAILENAVLIEQRPTRLVEILERLGKLRWINGDLPGALETYRVLQRKATAPDEQAQLHRRRAEVLLWMTHFKEAQEEVERGLSLVPPEPSLEAARLHHLRAYIHLFSGSEDQAREAVEKVAAWLPGLPPAPDVSAWGAILRGILNLSRATVKDPALALRDCQLAADLFRNLGQQHYAGWALANAAGAAIQLRRTEEALRYLDKAVTLAEESGLLIDRLNALFNKANYLIELGELRSAEDLLEETFRLSRLVHPSFRKVAHYGQFASLYYWQGRIEEARESLENVLKDPDVESELPTLEERIGALSFMVRLCILTRDENSAESYLREAEVLALQTPARDVGTWIHWAEGLLSASKGRAKEAESSYLQALESSPRESYALRHSPNGFRSGLLLDYGRFLLGTGRGQKAKEVLLQARDEPESPFEPLERTIGEAIRSLGPR